MEEAIELVARHGLGEVVVHARAEALLARAGAGVGGHGDDRRARHARRDLAAADLGGGRVAVELRHLAVHEHGDVAAAHDRVDGLEPVGGHVDLVAALLGHDHADALVDGVVLDEEQARAGGVIGVGLERAAHGVGQGDPRHHARRRLLVELDRRAEGGRRRGEGLRREPGAPRTEIGEEIGDEIGAGGMPGALAAMAEVTDEIGGPARRAPEYGSAPRTEIGGGAGDMASALVHPDGASGSRRR